MQISGVVVIAACAALAGCGSGGEEPGGGGKPSARRSAPSPAAGATAVQVQPGLWEVAYATTEVSGNGMPPAAIAALQGHKETKRDCITPEQARRPIRMQGDDDKSCDYSHFSMAGGRMQGSVTCAHGSSGKVTMTMEGRFSPQSFDYAARMVTEGKDMNMTMAIRAAGRRLGECPAAGGEGG